MSNESREIIKKYKTQIIFLLFSLIAVFVSIIVIQDLINIEKGLTTYKKARIKDKSILVAWIVFIISFYFAYNALKQYLKNKTKANLSFLIAVLLGLIGTLIKLVSLYKENDIMLEAEDFI